MIRAIMIVAGALTLTGCGESGRIFGFERGGPDEFTVVRNPPLSVPPQATLRPPAEGAARSNRDRSSKQARASLLAAGGPKAGSAGTLVTDGGATPYYGGPLAGGKTGNPPDYQTTQPQAGTTDPGARNTAAAANNAALVPIRYGAQSRRSAGEAALAQRATAYYGVEPDVRRKVNEESVQVALEQEKFLHKVLFWLEPDPPGVTLDANAESRRLRENEALGKPANAGEAPIVARKKSGISSLF